MHRSVWDADCAELISAGYGSTPRSSIPQDWQTNRGKDAAWGHDKEHKPYSKRMTWRERYDARQVELGRAPAEVAE